MVQVDVFWSFGIGAGFGLAAARQLRVRHDLRSGAAEGAELSAVAGSPGTGNGGVDQLKAELAGEPAPVKSGRWADFVDLLQNRYMVMNILYATLLFAPSGLYLVWDFPEWETMQAGTRGMPAWLIILFAITNVTQAILGFWVVERLVVHGRQYLAMLATWFGYFGLFFLLVNGWDKTGWHRFFSENRADFLTWNNEPALDQMTSWMTSSVALTLYAMGLILIPVLAVGLFASILPGYRIGGQYAPDRKPHAWWVLGILVPIGIFSGIPVAVVAHNLIIQLGWIIGSLASAALIYLILMRPKTGIFFLGYRELALEDRAYKRLLAGRGGQPKAGASVSQEPAEAAG